MNFVLSGIFERKFRFLERTDDIFFGSEVSGRSEKNKKYISRIYQSVQKMQLHPFQLVVISQLFLYSFPS